MMQVKMLQFEFDAKSIKTEDDKITIEGLASTSSVDLDNDIVLPTAFNESLSEYLKTGKLFWMHDPYDLPVGKVTEISVESGGLRIKAEVWADSGHGKQLIRAIKEGVVNAFSVGFRTVEAKVNAQTNPPVRTITKARLLEISVVQWGANTEALFAMQQKMSDRYKQTETNPKEGKESKTMPENIPQETLETLKKFEKMYADHPDIFDQAKSASAKVPEIEASLKNLQSLLNEQAAKFNSGFSTKADLLSATDALRVDMQKNFDELKKSQTAHSAIGSGFIGTHPGHYIKGFVWLTGDDGRALPDLQQKAYQLLVAPVDYKNVPNGELLRVIRKMNDSCLLIDSYMRKGNSRYDIRGSKVFQGLMNLIKLYDPSGEYKAMYSTGAGQGDEWVPTLMSSNLHDLLRLESGLINIVPNFEMPSNPFLWPIKTSGVTMYRADEASSDNPAVLTASNVGTSQVTFTATTLAGGVRSGKELNEDSIVILEQVVTSELVRAVRDTIEDIGFNGDNSASHFDTGRSLTSSSSNALVSWKGLRKIAVADSKTFDVQSSSAGVGDASSAFKIEDIAYGCKLLGEAGINKDDLCIAVNTDTWWKIVVMSSIIDTSQSGKQIIQMGNLDSLFGRQLYVSPKLQNNLASTGLYTGSGALSAMVIFNKQEFRIGYRRLATIEYQTDIWTQQLGWVVSARYDFQKLAASTVKPVSVGYNIAA